MLLKLSKKTVKNLNTSSAKLNPQQTPQVAGGTNLDTLMCLKTMQCPQTWQCA
ncbi:MULTISPECIES: hypothetical protein [Pseudoalteromonas]|uniref:Uncharacterized protein n=1 Tax=Pseudoalteromonas rubra TaxID=43658 RepID=A0A8T0C2R3_9GAMM|nr:MULTISPECIES: hypothetical protein [Pseudoalteromonas]KAF7783566.1 hypothetical protein PRUB_a3364 [Pseudoalteromonas rubra]MCG7563455.1 hypothetical protein [Pseudoalteromonas sp. McH1-42]MDK1312817.1 hypothetical protein [Pseudoalteromonas sp. R96]MEC4091426.1 hypothetical protein [Pseudoalteromonas rubra]